jgi:hypothetical protein
VKKISVSLLIFSITLFALIFFLQPKNTTIGIYVPYKKVEIPFGEIQREDFLQSIVNDPSIRKKIPKPKDKTFSAKRLLQELIIKKKEDHWILQLSFHDSDLEKAVLSAIMQKYQKMEKQACLLKERSRKEEIERQKTIVLKEIENLQKKQALLRIKDNFSKRKLQKKIEKIDKVLSTSLVFEDPFLPYIVYLEKQIQVFARFGLKPCETSKKQVFIKRYQKQKTIEKDLKDLLLIYQQIEEESPLNIEILHRYGLQEKLEKKVALQERLFTDRYLLKQEEENLLASMTDIKHSLEDELYQRVQRAIEEYEQIRNDVLSLGREQHGYYQNRLSQMLKQRSEYLCNRKLRIRLQEQNLKDKRDNYKKILFSIRKKELEKEKNALAIEWQLQQLKEKYRLLKEKELEHIEKGEGTFCLSIEKTSFWPYIYSGLLICLFLFFASIILFII